MFTALDELVAIEQRVSAARLLTAFLHGNVSMEIAGAFRLGSDVQRAFEFGLDAVVAGVITSEPEPLRSASRRSTPMRG